MILYYSIIQATCALVGSVLVGINVCILSAIGINSIVLFLS